MTNDNLVYIDDVPIGELRSGVFIQRVSQRHIYRRLNAKGMDVSLYFRLKQVCHTWTLIFMDTKQELSIPIGKIPKVAIRRKVGNAGEQFLVKLADFNKDRPEIQQPLLILGGKTNASTR